MLTVHFLNRLFSHCSVSLLKGLCSEKLSKIADVLVVVSFIIYKCTSVKHGYVDYISLIEEVTLTGGV